MCIRDSYNLMNHSPETSKQNFPLQNFQEREKKRGKPPSRAAPGPERREKGSSSGKEELHCSLSRCSSLSVPDADTTRLLFFPIELSAMWGQRREHLSWASVVERRRQSAIKPFTSANFENYILFLGVETRCTRPLFIYFFPQ